MPRRPDDSPNWGGARSNSGRPATGRNVVTVATCLPISLVQWLESEAQARKVTRSRLIAELLTAAQDRQEGPPARQEVAK